MGGKTVLACTDRMKITKGGRSRTGRLRRPGLSNTTRLDNQLHVWKAKKDLSLLPAQIWRGSREGVSHSCIPRVGKSVSGGTDLA